MKEMLILVVGMAAGCVAGFMWGGLAGMHAVRKQMADAPWAVLREMTECLSRGDEYHVSIKRVKRGRLACVGDQNWEQQ